MFRNRASALRLGPQIVFAAVLAGCVHGVASSAGTPVTQTGECPRKLNGPVLPPDAPEALRPSYLGVAYTHAQGESQGETLSRVWGNEHWKDAVAEEGEGKIDRAFLFCSARPIELWRAWSTHPTEEQAKDGSGPSKQIGKWWAVDPPKGGRAAFRRAYVVCTKWNRLEHVSRCTVDPGVVFAAGHGNGARCGGTEEYGPSAQWQVFIDVDDPRNAGKIRCTDTVDLSAEARARPLDGGLGHPGPTGDARLSKVTICHLRRQRAGTRGCLRSQSVISEEARDD